MLDKALSSLRNRGLGRELARGTLGSIGVKLCGMFLSFAVAILLARTLSPTGYGTYTYVFALITLFAIPAQIGLPNLLMRETAKAQVKGQWGLMRGLWGWTTVVTLIMSLALATFALAAKAFFGHRFSEVELITFAFGIALIPLIALGNLRGGALRGLRHVVSGQLPDAVLRPALLILMLLAAMKYGAHTRLLPSTAMGLHVAAAAFAFIIGTILLWRAMPPEVSAKPRPEYATRYWLTATLPLALISGVRLVSQNADILIIGVFRSAAEVGIYRVAFTLAGLIVLCHQAVNMAIAPYISRLHAQGDYTRLQRLVTYVTRVTLAISIPVTLAFVFFGTEIVVLAFGHDYAAAATPLAIIAIGQLVCVAMGPVGILLTMTGHERILAITLGGIALLNVLANMILIPYLGIEGAALTASLCLTLSNIAQWKIVKKQVGIESTALGVRESR